MSVRFDSAADRYSRSAAGFTLAQPFTIAGWFYVTSHRSDWSYFLGADDGGTGFCLIGLTNGNVLDVSISGSGNNTALTPTTGTWYFVALSYGDNATNHTVYYAADGAGSLTADVGGASFGIDPAWSFFIGTDGFSEWLNGRIADVRVWQAALTATELEAERRGFGPLRTANLWGWYHFKDGPSTTDSSGNGRTLTSAGTPTSEANPPIVDTPHVVTASCSVPAPIVTVPSHPSIRASATNNGTSAASVNVTLPTGYQVGDLLLVVDTVDNPSTTAVNTSSSGWVRLFHETHDAVSGNLLRFAAFAKIATGSDALTITGPTQDYALVSVAIKDHSVRSANLATDIVFPTPNDSTASTTPNPANNNPGVSQRWLWVAAAGSDWNAAGQAYSAVPANYTQVAIINSASSTSSCGTAVAYRQLTASSEDTGTFTSTNRPWIAVTFAIPPTEPAFTTPAGPTASVSVPAPTVDTPVGGGDANVSASVVTAAVSVPAPTVTAGASVTAAVVTAAGTVASPTVGAGAGVTTTVVTCAASVPAPVVTAGSNAAANPTVVTAAASVPAPSISTGTTATTSVVTAAASVPAPSASGAAAATPTVITATSSVPSPTATAGSSHTTAVVTAAASVPTPAVSAGSNANTSPAVITAAASVHAPTVTTAATATPAVVTAAASVPAPQASGGATVSPAAVTATVTLPTAVIAVGSTVVATTVTISGSVPTPGVSAGSNANVNATVVTASASVLATSVSSSAGVTASVVTVTTTIPAPVTSAAAAATAIVVGAIAEVLAPTVTHGLAPVVTGPLDTLKIEIERTTDVATEERATYPTTLVRRETFDR